MIEWLANEFAGQVLMPVAFVKSVWTKTQDVELAASFFNVSREAMQTRLQRLNLIDPEPERPHGYFRRQGLMPDSDIALAPCAA